MNVKTYFKKVENSSERIRECYDNVRLPVFLRTTGFLQLCRHQHVSQNSIWSCYLYREHSVKVIRVNCKHWFVDLELFTFCFDQGIAMLLISAKLCFCYLITLTNQRKQSYRLKKQFLRWAQVITLPVGWLCLNFFHWVWRTSFLVKVVWNVKKQNNNFCFGNASKDL